MNRLRGLIIVALCGLLVGTASAERLSDEELARGWNVEGYVGANAFLTGTDEWSGGGGNVFAAALFADLRSVFDLSLVFLDFRVQAEYGTVKSPGLPFRKGVDELDVDAYHVWQITSWVNPYIRITADSRFARGERIFNRNRQVRVFAEDGIATFTTDRLRITSPFAPTLFGEALGAHFQVVENERGFFSVMVGFGGRQLVTDDFLVERDDPETSFVEFYEVENYSYWGPEICLDFRYEPVDRLTLSSNADVFMGVDTDFVIEWKTIATYQIWRIFFLRGTFELQYDDSITSRVQLRQDLMLSVAFRFGTDPNG